MGPRPPVGGQGRAHPRSTCTMARNLLSRPDMRTTGTLERRPYDHATARRPEPGAAAQAGQAARTRAPGRRSRCSSEAQLAIAREYGFPSWPRLKAYVERVGPAARAHARLRGRGRLLPGSRRGPASVVASGLESAIALSSPLATTLRRAFGAILVVADLVHEGVRQPANRTGRHALDVGFEPWPLRTVLARERGAAPHSGVAAQRPPGARVRGCLACLRSCSRLGAAGSGVVVGLLSSVAIVRMSGRERRILRHRARSNEGGLGPARGRGAALTAAPSMTSGSPCDRSRL